LRRLTADSIAFSDYDFFFILDDAAGRRQIFKTAPVLADVTKRVYRAR